MMKLKLLLSMAVLFSVNLFSQEKKTIYASDDKNVIIVFPEPIKRAITGSKNFKFAFNTKSGDNYGLIRAVESKPSNLLVITASGLLYEFNVQYRKEISVFNYFILEDESVGNLIKKEDDLSKESDEENDQNEIQRESEGFGNVDTEYYDKPKKDESNLLYNTDRTEYYRKHSSNVINNKTFYKRYLTFNEDVSLKLVTIINNRKELYFILEMENDSGVSFNTNFIKFFKESSKKRKKASYQSIEVKPVYAYQNFKTIEGNSKKRAIYVFEKFGINKDKVFNIEVNEEKGERNLLLNVKHTEINNPQ